MNVLKNKWASAVYAVVIVLVAFIAMKGQPNAQFFAMSLGVLGVLGKELVSNQMWDNPFKLDVFLYGIAASVFTGIVMLLF